MHCCSELQYVIENSEAQSILTTKQHASQMEPLATKANVDLHLLDSNSIDESKMDTLSRLQHAAQNSIQEAQQAVDQHLSAVGHADEDGALIVYTSGTTGRPKGGSAVFMCCCCASTTGALHISTGLWRQIKCQKLTTTVARDKCPLDNVSM